MRDAHIEVKKTKRFTSDNGGEVARVDAVGDLLCSRSRAETTWPRNASHQREKTHVLFTLQGTNYLGGV